MALFFGGIPLLVLLAVAVGLNISARRLERRLASLVEDQVARVRHIEQALGQLKGESAEVAASLNARA